MTCWTRHLNQPRKDASPEPPPLRSEAEQLKDEKAKRWRVERYDAGLGWIMGPAEYGGRELGIDFSEASGGLSANTTCPQPRC